MAGGGHRQERLPSSFRINGSPCSECGTNHLMRKINRRFQPEPRRIDFKAFIAEHGRLEYYYPPRTE